MSLIFITSWLSNREVERSLYRAATSEAALKKERDTLELKVQERTTELRQAQAERINQFYRFAAVGRSVAGLLHDLVHPLSIVSHSLEKMDTRGASSNIVQRAVQSTKQMEALLKSARDQARRQQVVTEFTAQEEVQHVFSLYATKAQHLGIKLYLKSGDPVRITGSSIQFQQAIANLVSNAMDAYQGVERAVKRVEVSVEAKSDGVYLQVQDFGKGMTEDEQAKLFTPFYTTKQDKDNLGIGLIIVQTIIEQDFAGTLHSVSKSGEGTTFTIYLPNGTSAL